MAQAVPDFEPLIKPLQREQRTYFVLGSVIILLGAAVVIAMLGLPIVFPDTDYPQNDLLKIGGLGLSMSGAVPIGKWLSARSRIDSIRNMESQWRAYAAMAKPPKDKLKKLEDLLWKLTEKGVMGS